MKEIHMNDNRIDWIDYDKAFAIICVVLLHAHIPYPAKGLIEVWVIPLFFFLSGIFAHANRYSTFRDFFLHKGLHLLIPYLCFNIITYLFWFLAGRHYGYDAEQDVLWWKPLWGIIYGESSYLTHYVPMWFVACLFSTETLYYLLFRRIQSTKIYWLMVLGVMVIGGIYYHFNSIALPWGLSSAFSMMVFYAIGAFLSPRIHNNAFHMWLQVRNAIPVLIASLCTVIAVYIVNPGEVEVYKNEYGNYILFYIGAFAGIIFISIACKLLEQHMGHISWLSFIGRNTLVILCLHLVMFSCMKGITYFIFKLPLELYEQTWMILCGSLINIVLLSPIILGINRFFPFITGKFSLHEKNI